MAKRRIRFKKPKFQIKQSKIGAVLLILGFGLLFFTLVLRYSYIMLTGHSSGEDLIMKANEKYLVIVSSNQNEVRFMTEMAKS